MRTLFYILLISCLIVTNIYANDNDVEINRSAISETEEIDRPKNNESRKFKIMAGFCINDIFGNDFNDQLGYGVGAGFRIGYGINIMPRLTLESTYTITFHGSDIDTAGAELFKLNAFNVNFKYVLTPIRKISFYLNIGWGLDLFAIKEIDAGYFSYIPYYGAGSYIYLSENIDLDLGFNVHIVGIGLDSPDELEGNYTQFLLLLSIKL